MKSISIACLFLLASCQAAAQSAQTPGSEIKPGKEKCAVAGTVVRLDTGESLKKATVALWNRESEDHSFFDITDDKGHFQFENLPPGLYGLRASRNGYVPLRYGEKKPGDPGAGLMLTPGQKLSDLLFRLPRTATIAGRVFDEEGEPLPGAEVKAYQVFRRRGKHDLGAVSSVSTNDLGEYRIFGLAPGRYYVAAAYSAREDVRGLVPSSVQILNEGYLLTFYPNTADPSKAQTVTLNAGDEFPSVDFLMKPAHLVTVSGKVFSAIPGWQGRNTFVELTSREYSLSQAGPRLNAQVRNKDGGFEIQDVPPGTYYLRAFWRDEGTFDSYWVNRELEVGSSGVDGVALTISRGVDVPGHLTWEGKPPADVQDIQIGLRSLKEDVYSWNSGARKVKPDGTFLIKNVQEGVYVPQVFTGSWDCFLKSAYYRTANVTDGGLAVHPGSDASLELTMSSRAARVEGVVLDAHSLPAAGVYVALIPDARHRDNEWKYRQETTDQNGRFTLRGIVPGDYKVFSWDSADDFDWYDAEMVKPYESRGTSVSIAESDRKSLQLTVIETMKSPQSSQ